MAEHIAPQYKHLKKAYDAAVQCNRCGFCETVCPTYVASGKETNSPRGRNQAFRQILEGKLNPVEAKEIFTSCLTCHACTNVCYSEVPVAQLMGEARTVVNAAESPDLSEKIMTRFFLFHRSLLSIFVWAAFLFKRLGVSALLKKSGLLKLLSPELDVAEDLIQDVPLRFGARAAGKTYPAQGPKIAYFSGCGIHWIFPDVSQAFIDIFDRSERNLATPRHACCGLAAQSAGDIDSARELARKNIEQFEKLDADVILTDDDSCSGYLKNYGDLLDGDLRAMAFANKVKNLSQFIEESGLKPEFKSQEGKTLTYHDNCQTGNGCGLVQPPRDLLEKIPGTKFVELNEANWCCGGAGTYGLKHPDLAEQVLERKMENIKKSGAQTVVAQASSCLMHIQHGLKTKGWKDVNIVHLAELIKRI